MANLVQISGLPGSGKTTGLRFLPPKETVVIDTDKKGLSWAGWKKDYNKESKNYFATSDINSIIKILAYVESTPAIKYLVIDTVNSIMNDREVADAKRPSFDKWKDMAVDVYELYDRIRGELRDDLVVFVMAHIIPYEADGETHWKTKLGGRYLSKLDLNSKLNYNLYTQIERDGEGPATYSLITQSNGRNEARSAMGVLDFKVENNLLKVGETIREKELAA